MQIKELMERERMTKVFPYVLGFLALTSLVGYLMLILGFNSLSRKTEAAPLPSPFTKLSVSAKSAIVLDLTTGKVLYEKNADEPLPLASITKVMTALVAAEKAGSLKEVEITESDLTPEGDSGLLVNSKWDLKKLIDYSLLVSSNDGARAIALAVGAFENKITQNEDETLKTFVTQMNLTAKKIGMYNTMFFNEHGLDRDVDHVGAYGSARDIAKLFSYSLRNYPNLLEATKYPHITFTDKGGFVHEANNTNISTNEIPNLLASKTGFTDLAGGNLAIAFDAGLGRPVIISVLGSTQEGRFADVLNLASTTLEYFRQEK